MTLQLRYHRRAVGLPPKAQRFSESAHELLQQREEQLGVRFPASVREWYCLDGAVGLLERYSNDDWLVDVERLGEPFDNWHGRGPRDFLSENLLLFMHENQGVCNWAIKLDGTPDPPVVVEVDTAAAGKWLPCADHFSTFVWCQIWDHSQLAVGEQAQEAELSKHDLALLKASFPQLATTFGWPGNVNYRFATEAASILIWDGEGGADWFLTASTASDLKKLLAKVWHF